MVGGAPMFANKNIIENAVNSKDHTTLVAAVKAAGLVDTLSGPGPFTVFAPTNEAFTKLPKGTVDNLLKPENKGQLQAVLTYHVIPGALTTNDLLAKIKEGGGKAEIKTVQGEPLTFKKDGKGVDGDRQQGRSFQDHDPQRHAVQRRDPGHQRRDATLIPSAGTKRLRGPAASAGPFSLAAILARV